MDHRIIKIHVHVVQLFRWVNPLTLAYVIRFFLSNSDNLYSSVKKVGKTHSENPYSMVKKDRKQSDGGQLKIAPASDKTRDAPVAPGTFVSDIFNFLI